MTKTLEELQGVGDALYVEKYGRKAMNPNDIDWNQDVYDSSGSLVRRRAPEASEMMEFIRREREKAWKAGQLSGVELAKENLPEKDTAWTGNGSDLLERGEANGWNGYRNKAITNLTNLQGELGK